MLRSRLLIALATVVFAVSMGNAGAWDGPLEQAFETREGDRSEAAAKGDDPIDTLFAPADDAFTDWNKEMNQQSDADNAPTDGGDGQK
ncbi:MAG: hypothetical protein WBM71_16660 [Sedimenticolaceae bacterium]